MHIIDWQSGTNFMSLRIGDEVILTEKEWKETGMRLPRILTF